MREPSGYWSAPQVDQVGSDSFVYKALASSLCVVHLGKIVGVGAPIHCLNAALGKHIARSFATCPKASSSAPEAHERPWQGVGAPWVRASSARPSKAKGRKRHVRPAVRTTPRGRPREQTPPMCAQPISVRDSPLALPPALRLPQRPRVCRPRNATQRERATECAPPGIAAPWLSTCEAMRGLCRLRAFDVAQLCCRRRSCRGPAP